MIKVQLAETYVPGKRLGRHVEHDPRSRNHAFGVTASILRHVKHRRYGGVFDQGDLGSCTGNAAAGAMNTEPLHLLHKHLLQEKDAVQLYESATILDGFPGSYPPDDTGSSGLAVAKAAKQKGLISGYKHAFGIDEALAALQVAAVITGVNWYEDFDNPLADGFVMLGGQIRGGHEFLVREYGPQHTNSPLDDVVGSDNSWGHGWGHAGRFFFTVRTWGELLEQDGDVTILIK